MVKELKTHFLKLVCSLVLGRLQNKKKNPAYSLLSELFSRNPDLSCFPLYGFAFVLGEHLGKTPKKKLII